MRFSDSYVFGVYLILDIFYCLSSNPQQVLVNERPKVLASKCAKKSNCGIKTVLPKLMYWNWNGMELLLTFATCAYDRIIQLI